MKLYEVEGKNARIILDDGTVLEGFAYDYTSAQDNEPDPESITIGHTEIFAPEIVKIELI